jgi:hypothetical protein
MATILTRCPVCEAALGISELTCERCQTRIHGRFDPCRFCRLAPEHLAFVETFLRCEGNLSRVEKELNVSYPTVRNRLSAALTALGLANGSVEPAPAPSASPLPPDPETSARRRVVLESLAQGTVNAEDAAAALREMF